MANTTCQSGCGRDIGEARFIYMGIDFPLHDEGDLVVSDIEETEFNEHTDHRGENLVYTVKAATMVTLTVNLSPCTPEYNELWEMWRCNKRICGQATVYLPCCGTITYEAVRVRKMAFPTLSFENPATQIQLVGYLPTCN